MRCYIHDNNNRTNQKSQKAIHMYPHCQEWFHPKIDQRATLRWNEVTLSSAVRRFVVTGFLLVPPLRPPGCPGAHTRTHTHRNPLVSPRRPPETEEGTARWDTPLSCGGIGWRGRCRSSAGLSPSLAAWARNVPLCVCGS